MQILLPFSYNGFATDNSERCGEIHNYKYVLHV